MSGPANVIIQEAPAGVELNPTVDLSLDKFESLVWKKGVPVFHDKIVKCPCAATNTLPDKSLSRYPSPNCRSCGGTGYVLIERVQTKMVVQGMNLDTKFKEWSEERVGTVKITANQEDKLSFMDRIILLQGETFHNEVIYPKFNKNTCFSYLIYEPLKIEVAFLFEKEDTKLVRLKLNDDYTIDSNLFILNNKYSKVENLKVSVKYSHRPQFHVIDMIRDVINSETLDQNNLPENANFPLGAIGRRSHYVLDRQNYNGDYILDNTIDPCNS